MWIRLIFDLQSQMAWLWIEKMSIELYITVWVEHWSRANILYQTSQRVIHSNSETLILPIMIVNGLSKSTQDNQNHHQNSLCTFNRHLHHHLVRVLQGRLQGEEGILEPSRKEVREIGSWYGGSRRQNASTQLFPQNCRQSRHNFDQRRMAIYWRSDKTAF